MSRAEVGDDVWGEDPTVRRLEEEMARRLGKQARTVRPERDDGQSRVCRCADAPRRRGHRRLPRRTWSIYEVGGTAIVAGVQLRLLDSPDGIARADGVTAAVRETNIHQPVSSLLCIENTHNRRGGAAVDPERVHGAARAAHILGLRVHCDGARLFNAAVALGVSPSALVDECDTVSVCISKALGAPVGSVVVGDVSVIDEVRRWRKRLGGGMRQAGIIAEAGLYALEHNVERLADDHSNAKIIADRSGAPAPQCGVRQCPPTS